VAGTLARASAAGHPVAVVSATRGEAGEVARPALATKENLGEGREGGPRPAWAAGGVGHRYFPGYNHGHLAEGKNPEAIGRIVGHLRRFRPDVVVTFPANGGYGHFDHMAIYRYVVAAVPPAADPGYTSDYTIGLPPHRVRKLYYSTIPRERILRM